MGIKTPILFWTFQSWTACMKIWEVGSHSKWHIEPSTNGNALGQKDRCSEHSYACMHASWQIAIYIYVYIVEVSFPHGFLIWHPRWFSIRSPLISPSNGCFRDQDVAGWLASAHAAAITHLTGGSGRRGGSLDGYGGFLKWGYPQSLSFIIYFNRIFDYKKMVPIASGNDCSSLLWNMAHWNSWFTY